MNQIKKAIEALGGVSATALILGVKPPTVSEWVRGIRPIPSEKCVAIERALNGRVSRTQLYSGDARALWPELFVSKTTTEATQ